MYVVRYTVAYVCSLVGHARKKKTKLLVAGWSVVCRGRKVVGGGFQSRQVGSSRVEKKRLVELTDQEGGRQVSR
jgi:hypothetical protein